MISSPPPEDEVLGRLYDRRMMRRLLAYGATIHRCISSWTAGFMTLWSGAQLAGPYLIRWPSIATFCARSHWPRPPDRPLPVLPTLAAGVRSAQIMRCPT